MEVQYQSYADNLNEASTAYQTLSSGQSLNLNQLEEMRSKYPQIDDYLKDQRSHPAQRRGPWEAADAQKEATVSLPGKQPAAAGIPDRHHAEKDRDVGV